MVRIKLNDLLAKSGKKRYWLVRELETNYTYLNKLLNGSAGAIHLSTIEKLCRLFACTPNDLFEVVDDDKG